MRKLLALLFVLLILSTPFLKTVQAGYTESLDIPKDLFDPQSYDIQRNILLNELISQIVFYENYLGKNKIPPNIKVVLSGNDIPNFNLNKPGVNGNSIYLIQTPDDYSNLGKFNTIFSQLIYLNFPNANDESVDIAGTFLNLRYFKANISKFAGLYRYINSNQYLYDNPLLTENEKPLSPALQMLSVAKLAQMESEDLGKMKEFLVKSLQNGFRSNVSSTGMDFATFIRSTKLSLPNLKLASILTDIETRFRQLWDGKFYLRNGTDYKIRLDATKDIENARFFIAMGDDVKSRIMLDKVDIYLKQRIGQEHSWWFVFLGLILLVALGFVYAHNRLFVSNAVNSRPQNPPAQTNTPKQSSKKTISRGKH